MLKIDHSTAERVLKEATEKVKSQRPYKTESPLSDSIGKVISGTHLTFRYILLTGLLAKAVEPKINPLCLQAGAPLKGAYDARSLCHKVIVPNEQSLLSGKLGGSNEPFLNKPARFTHLSVENAVRKGSDLETLKLVISILGNAVLKKEAVSALQDCIFHILQRQERAIVGTSERALSSADNSCAIKNILDIFLSKSYEGETSVIVVGTLLKMLYAADAEVAVKTHPTNEAGSSSKEVCDIDIVSQDKTLMGAEVKDKNYSQHDIAHAVNKAVESGLTKMMFIKGRSAKTSPAYVSPEGFNLHILEIDSFIETTLAVLFPISFDDFLVALKNTAVEIRAKDTTHDWLATCLEK